MPCTVGELHSQPPVRLYVDCVCMPCTVGELKHAMSDTKVIGAVMVNCGVDIDCGDQAFSVQLYSGDRNVDPPKICVNGK